MGLTLEQIEALPAKPADALTSQLFAPISGTVVDKSIYAGQYVQEGESCLRSRTSRRCGFSFARTNRICRGFAWGRKWMSRRRRSRGKSSRVVIKFIDPNLDEATRSTTGSRGTGKSRSERAAAVFASALRRWGGASRCAGSARRAAQRDHSNGAGGGGFCGGRRRGVCAARAATRSARGCVVEVISGLTAGDQVVVQGNLLMDGQAEMNRAFATHAPMPENTNEAAALPALTETQRSAANNFLAVADAVTAALAADDLEGL
jgi:membrane fusion protein, copper/silver efflux system